MFTLAAQNAHLDVLEGLQAGQARAYAAQVSTVLAWFDLVAADQGTCTDLAAVELAPALRLGQAQAGTLLRDAIHLRDRLPVLRAALITGTIWPAQAKVLLDQTHDCSAAVCAAVETRLLGPDGTAAAGQLCPSDLRRRVRRAVLAAESEFEAEQQAQHERDARAARDVTMRPARSGMVHLFAILSIEQALGHARDLDALCRKVAAADKTAGIKRTAAQRRADILAMLPSIALHAWDHPAHPATPTALATEPELQDDGTPGGSADSGSADSAGAPGGGAPADLSDGGGRAAGSPGWAGCPFGPGGIPAGALGPPENRHDPSAGLTRFLMLRDPLCTGPGCNNAARRCDLDHERPYRTQDTTGQQQAGLTTAANLSPKSRRCHRAKTPHRDNPHPWTSVRHPDGSTTWTNPLGRTHTRPGYWTPPPDPRPAPHLPGPPTGTHTDPRPLPDGADGQLWWQLTGPTDRGLHPDLTERLTDRAARLAGTKKARAQAAEHTHQARALRDGVDRHADPFCTTGRVSTEPFTDEPPF